MFKDTNQIIIYRPVFRQNLTAKIDFRNAEFHFRNVEFHSRNAEFHSRNAEFHFRNAEFHFRNVEFHFRNVEFHFRNAEFHFRNDAELFHTTTNQHFNVFDSLTTLLPKDTNRTYRNETNKTLHLTREKTAQHIT